MKKKKSCNEEDCIHKVHLRSTSPQSVLWVIGMVLVGRSELMEEDAVEVFHYYGFHLSYSFFM